MVEVTREPRNTPLPDYDKPPVIEVVCGITFKPMEKLLAPHLGLYWERIKDRYSECAERTPLAPVIEAQQGRQPVEIEIIDVPPMPRLWFVNKESNELIQIQRDRFLHNWRKKNNEAKYPKYDAVMKEFTTQVKIFCDFVSELDLGSIEPLQYELTYVNHIPHGDCWESPSDLSKLFVAFNKASTKGEFLREVEGVDWTTTFCLPNESGRLYAQLRTAIKTEDKSKLLQFNLTARGISSDTSLDGMQSWFDLAHDNIVRSFSDLTTDDAQKIVWKRK